MAPSASLLWLLGFSAVLLALLPQHYQVHAGIPYEKTEGFDLQQQVPASAPTSAPLNCTSACELRCSKAGRPNICERACETCCGRCQCVPPGTSGNQQVCGACYTNQTTHGGKSKCP